MRKGIVWRLLALEAMQGEKIPTFEEFRTQWEQMDALSRALYAEVCSNRNNYKGEPRSYRRFLDCVRAHLRKMRILTGDDCPSLMELAGELEAGGHEQ